MITPERLLCDEIVAEALSARATDIHLDPLIDGYTVRFRVDGAVYTRRRLDKADGERVLNQFKSEAGVDPGSLFVPRTSRRKYRLTDRDLDARFTFAPCISGQKLAIRLLDPERLRHEVEDLGMDEKGLAKVNTWLERLSGTFVVAGPTGSGKTTTLYAILNKLAEHQRHILTIEDPVEYEIDGVNQIQVDQRNGVDFAGGLRSMLRMDPDYLMVGELRDPESAEVAARAAISGHVLLTTIHARNAVSVVTGLRNMGLSSHQISVSLSVIVNQRLVRKLCPECSIEAPVSADDRSWVEYFGLKPPEVEHRSGPAGCEACAGTGFFGRTGVFEIWHLDEADYDLLLAGADEHTLWKHLTSIHHTTLLESALDKIRDGITPFEEIRGFGEGMRGIASDR